MYANNMIDGDRGEDCFSPYHNSNRCPVCRHENCVHLLRESFRREYELIEEKDWDDAQMKIDALGELEDKYQELNIDISKITEEGMSYLDF